MCQPRAHERPNVPTCRSVRCWACCSDEFPDVTISKIRFLESQGLIEPERTAVGLPQVLRRRRRAAALHPARAARALPAAQGDPATGWRARRRPVASPSRRRPATARRRHAAGDEPTAGRGGRRRRGAAPPRPRPPAVTEPGGRSGRRAAERRRRPQPPRRFGAVARRRGAGPIPTRANRSSSSTPPRPARRARCPPDGEAAVPARTAAAAPGARPAQPPRVAPTAGIDGKLLDELEAYGLVSARSLGQQPVYDGAARQICEIAGRRSSSSASRPATFAPVEVVGRARSRPVRAAHPAAPAPAQPPAREQSTALLEQMTTLGANLRHVLVAQALRQYTAELSDGARGRRSRLSSLGVVIADGAAGRAGRGAGQHPGADPARERRRQRACCRSTSAAPRRRPSTYALEQIEAPRPLTHDLFVATSRRARLAR